MDKSSPQTIFLKDYRAPEFRILSIDLSFFLDESASTVVAKTQFERQVNDGGPLVLDGRDLVLNWVALDGKRLESDGYSVTPEALTLENVPQSFTLEIETTLRPQDNSTLMGLYKTSGTFCTQCEAEGFRKITYYLDRPDVMARFRTRIEAEKERYPVLLSNGNPVEIGDLPNGRHYAVWDDPFPKPSYLFALVAGNLVKVPDTFTTRSGRKVDLAIYVEPGNEDKCAHAMDSLKRSMKWDEDVYGREYDLDIFNIVAVADFNMGAMENKGLNIFNTRYVLARPETATDMDFQGIESVIAHEYFHNWSGDRVTCRDWFQLSLKEGFTVFRDQQFSADMGSPTVKRIVDVETLRRHQFPEDAGPMAHPVRPESYIEINNFYTMTVYEKGAEVVRMIHTLLGPDRFRAGTDLYFDRHDGQAVTCDDFVKAMEEASGVDLTQFRLWYAQAGTPDVTASDRYDAEQKTYTLTLSQSLGPTPGQALKQPMHIPIAVGLVDPDGNDIPLRLAGESSDRSGAATRTLDLRQTTQSFEFVNVPAKPVPSLLRGFSAPVKLKSDLKADDLRFLMAHDSDPFNRWESAQRLAEREILSLVEAHQAGVSTTVPEDFVSAFTSPLFDATLDDGSADFAFVSRALALPSEHYLGQQMTVIDVDAIHAVRDQVKVIIGTQCRDRWLQVYNQMAGTGTANDGRSIGRRSLRNAALAYLSAVGGDDCVVLANAQYRDAETMTERLAALSNLVDLGGDTAEVAIDDFYQTWQNDPLVVDKWFGIQAMSSRAGALDRVRDLMAHPAFTWRNPNRLRSVLGAFSMINQVGFHQADGGGYTLLGNAIVDLDGLNPQVAARLLMPFQSWRRFDTGRQKRMRDVLERVLRHEGLSRDTYEMATRCLS